MHVGASRRRIAEIWAESPAWSFDARAKAVAERLASVHAQGDEWWRKLLIAQIGNTPVVAVRGIVGSTAPALPPTARVEDGAAAEGAVYIVTADKPAAQEFGLSQRALADHLRSAIRNALEPQKWGRRTTATPSAAEVRTAKHETAILARQAGDDAWSSGDLSAAVAHYREALQADAAYAAARLRLAEVLLQLGRRREAAREAQIVRTSRAVTPDQRNAATAILSRAR
jgi:tetratricopeptide (TPR) repeat protein